MAFMKWRLLAGREQGTSHLSDNTPCEDYFVAEVINDTLWVFVADGAGSAVCGGQGAEIACETAMALVKSQSIETADEQWANDCVSAIQNALTDEAEQSNNSLRDYACTFLGLVVSEDKTLCFQIGDGAIIVDVGEGLEVPIQPMQGEYANMTHFVSEEKALDNLIIRSFDCSSQKIAVMTDGLQRLALNLAENTAHAGFFSPFFQALQTAPVSQNAALQTALENFLNSEAVNARTDDDKTLVLGIKQ